MAEILNFTPALARARARKGQDTVTTNGSQPPINQVIPEDHTPEGEFKPSLKEPCPWEFEVRGIVQGKQGYMEVSIKADRFDKIGTVLRWCTEAGIKPFSVNTPNAPSSKGNGQVTKPPKPGNCPACGGNRWGWDKQDKGWYCATQRNGNYCGFKTWKDGK